MESVDGLSQMTSIDMRIDLRGADVRVPKQFLNHAQISAARHQVRRKGVAQQVRMHPANASNAGVLSNNLPQCYALNGATSVRKEQTKRIARIRKARQVRPQIRHIRLHGINRWHTKRNNPLLVSLANDIHNSQCLIEVIHLQRAHFTGT